MDGVKWVDELPAAGGRGNAGIWIARLEPLKAQPGRWAEVARGRAGSIAKTSSTLRSGVYSSGRKKYRMILPAGRFAFTMRTIPDGDGKVSILFARYLGPDETSQPAHKVAPLKHAARGRR